MDCMKRREFITLVGGAAAAPWPLAAWAQQPVLPVVGFVNAGTPAANVPYVALLRQTLNEAGYVDGRNLAIEFRWAEARPERYAALVAELLQRRVTVIVAGGGSPLALAAKAATSTIPIVFIIGADPVEVGLVGSLSRPGGNVTGVTMASPLCWASRLTCCASLSLARANLPTSLTLQILSSEMA
jgi:putative ABC transport system substrate-binding protein